ncbi:MAG: methionine gamma-lyase family protein, partial [Halanaerobiales bacterium]
MNKFYEKSKEFVVNIESQIKDIFVRYEDIAFHNQKKILSAFINNNVSDNHLNGSTGYGYNDIGRDTLDKIYAEIFNAEAAVVRGQFVSGTHAISAVLNGLLFPKDEIIFATGNPYETLHKIIGWTSSSSHSLINKGVKVSSVELENNSIDIERVLELMNDKTKIIHFQKSRGYTKRNAFSNIELERAFKKVKSKNKDIIIFVDNCYGE